jgi:hypothetical protein
MVMVCVCVAVVVVVVVVCGGGGGGGVRVCGGGGHTRSSLSQRPRSTAQCTLHTNQPNALRLGVVCRQPRTPLGPGAHNEVLMEWGQAGATLAGTHETLFVTVKNLG